MPTSLPSFLRILLLGFLAICLGASPIHAKDSTATKSDLRETSTNRLVPREEFPVVEHEATRMGTEISILIATEDRAKASAAIADALAEIGRIEELMTDWREDSELERFNRAAGTGAISINPEILFLLYQAKKVSDLTDGGFDITTSGLRSVWGNFVSAREKLPSPESVKEALALVDYRKVGFDLKKETAWIEKKGMRVGLGGIAKGYAVDRAAMKIKAHGFEDFAIKAGGDLTVRGKRGGKLWWVAIQDPRDKSKTLAYLPATNVSVSTSGDYERFYMIGGKRYAHILDPRTGYPVDHTQSVTVVSRDAVYTDALSTGLFVEGPEKGMALVERLSNVDALFVDAGGHVTLSKGLQKGSKR